MTSAEKRIEMIRERYGRVSNGGAAPAGDPEWEDVEALLEALGATQATSRELRESYESELAVLRPELDAAVRRAEQAEQLAEQNYGLHRASEECLTAARRGVREQRARAEQAERNLDEALKTIEALQVSSVPVEPADATRWEARFLMAICDQAKTRQLGDGSEYDPPVVTVSEAAGVCARLVAPSSPVPAETPATATFKVGDPDASQSPMCGAWRDGYVCTRASRHDGDHAAGNGVIIVKAWPAVPSGDAGGQQ